MNAVEMKQKKYSAWTLSTEQIREMSTWEYKKFLRDTATQRPSLAQQIHAYLFEFPEDSFAGRAALLFAAIAIMVAAWWWRLPFSGLVEDVWTVAFTATVIAAITVAWEFSRFVTKWESEEAQPRHRRPRS